jgi:replicative DNA helicase
MTANPLLAAALTYHQLGYHPIPCASREKRPLVAWKDFQTTSPTVDQVRAWWTQTPNANVALVLGRGRFAVDLDGGVDAESLLAAEGIALPPLAPRSRTGSGFHVFLSSYNPIPDRVGLLSTHGGKPQVDIRGIGIVVAPPSIHPNGAVYEWLVPLESDLPKAPFALTELIHKAPAPVVPAQADGKSGGRYWVADAIRGVGEGQRDQMCARLAGYLLNKGLDPDTAIAILSTSFAPNCQPAFSIRDVEKTVRSIAQRESVEGTDRSTMPRHISEVLADFQTALSKGPSPTLATPFPTLNLFLNGGFGPGELIFLGARPGVGKTALGLEFARRTGLHGADGAVLIISREMTNLALSRRLVAQDGRVRASAIKRASLNESEQWHVSQAVERLTTAPIYFSDDAVSLGEIQTIVATMTAEAPLALVVVDYLQLIRAPREIKERRHQVEAISQGLKTLALQYRVPVLCLSSLSRASGDDRNRPPTLSSLRESGELEHDADIILLLHRQYHEANTVCTVAKNRDGRLGTVNLLFRSDFVAFDEAALQSED